MSFFDDFDWGGLIGGIGKTIPAIVASSVGARKVAQGNQQAVQVAQQTGAQNQQLIQNAVGNAAVARAPATAHFREVMAQDPTVLTPQQQIQIDDSGRALTNKNAIGTVGGRALSRMYADTTGRLKANAVEQNKARTDAAAGQVSSIAGQDAALSVNAANAQVANNNNVATNVGNATVSTANVNADTYGVIANALANSTKDADRESRYAEYKDVRR